MLPTSNIVPSVFGMRKLSQLPPDLLACLAILTRRALTPKPLGRLLLPPSPPLLLRASVLPPIPLCRILQHTLCRRLGRPWPPWSRSLNSLSLASRSLSYYSTSSTPDNTNDTIPPTPTPASTAPTESSHQTPKPPFTFLTGYALYAKRTPRPFPPPFLSPPSGSFSDPLSTHDRARPSLVNGELIRGTTNGDDAVFASSHFICANDGVGAWSTRPRGHAGLWARLILHFWAGAIEDDIGRQRAEDGCFRRPDPTAYLQRAYEDTVKVTGESDWHGTTTACGALLHWKEIEEEDKGLAEAAGKGSSPCLKDGRAVTPWLYVTQLGDSQVMVVRPSEKKVVFKTKEQWHWFDCPRQLGTNSPDTPATDAVVDEVSIREGDVVLAMSDGVIDNLWSHEIVECVSDSVARWAKGEGRVGRKETDIIDGGMTFVAHELVERAKKIALDPFAESPFMEHAIEEGLPSVGGKLNVSTLGLLAVFADVID